jgi:hypothetical protein
MPIVFDCTCGKKLQARDELAGKTLKCPSCHQLVPVPAGPPLATPVLAGISPSALPPLHGVPAFHEENDIHSTPATPPAPVPVTRWDRSFDQQPTPWQGNEGERLKFRDLPDFLFIFVAVLVVCGLTVGAFFIWKTEEKPARAARDNKQQETGWLQGKITYKGLPLPSGLITFHSGGERFEEMIRPDGSYDAIGLPPAQYKVSVMTMEIKGFPAKGPPQIKGPGKGGPPKKGGPPPQYTPPKYVPIPRKYADPNTSDLEVEVKIEKKNFNIDLKD